MFPVIMLSSYKMLEKEREREREREREGESGERIKKDRFSHVYPLSRRFFRAAE